MPSSNANELKRFPDINGNSLEKINNTGTPLTHNGKFNIFHVTQLTGTVMTSYPKRLLKSEQSLPDNKNYIRSDLFFSGRISRFAPSCTLWDVNMTTRHRRVEKIARYQWRQLKENQRYETSFTPKASSCGARISLTLKCPIFCVCGLTVELLQGLLVRRRVVRLA